MIPTNKFTSFEANVLINFTFSYDGFDMAKPIFVKDNVIFLGADIKFQIPSKSELKLFGNDRQSTEKKHKKQKEPGKSYGDSSSSSSFSQPPPPQA